MPIKIPDQLPAKETLKSERIPLIEEHDAIEQDIRPLEILILNLMPDKISTEAQLMRVLGATPLQVQVTLMRTASYESKNTHKEHLISFYKTHDEIKNKKFDALIITGAPVEQMNYEDVEYWPELQTIFEWAKTHVHDSLYICWGAQAALYHHHGVQKHELPKKQFGVINHYVAKPYEPLINGFDDTLYVPVSRHTEVRRADVEHIDGLDILLESEETGLCLLHDPKNRRSYMFNHLEYDAETLNKEYHRDKEAGLDTNIPKNYYPDDNPQNPPHISWRAHRHLFFSNWINIVYQGTPFDFIL